MRREVTWEQLGCPRSPRIMPVVGIGSVEILADDIQLAEEAGGRVAFPLDEKQPAKGGLPARLGRPARTLE